ncbi:hypothetical protein [Porticoccus sp.]
MACKGCDEERARQEALAKQATGDLLRDKRVVSWRAWFVSLDEPLRLLRFNSDEHGIDDLPTDGFQFARTKFADGTGENIGGGGWVIYQETSAGLIFQSTGDNVPPDPLRYPGAKLIKDKLCPSALLHVAMSEAR